MEHDIIYESLAEPIYVSILVGESLVVNCVYQGYIVTFLGRDIIANLTLLDMVYFDVILGVDYQLIMLFLIAMQRW